MLVTDAIDRINSNNNVSIEAFRAKEIACACVTTVANAFTEFRTLEDYLAHGIHTEMRNADFYDVKDNLTFAKRAIINGLEFQGHLFYEGQIIIGRNNAYEITNEHTFVRVSEYKLWSRPDILKVTPIYNTFGESLSSPSYCVNPFFFRPINEEEEEKLRKWGAL